MVVFLFVGGAIIGGVFLLFLLMDYFVFPLFWLVFDYFWGLLGIFLLPSA